jgi:hypothetical protein
MGTDPTCDRLCEVRWYKSIGAALHSVLSIPAFASDYQPGEWQQQQQQQQRWQQK